MLSIWEAVRRAKYSRVPATAEHRPSSQAMVTGWRSWIFWKKLVAMRPVRVLKKVASRMGKKTSAGLAAPCWAR